MSKVVQVGYENFKKIIDKDIYYIDKTLFIKDIIQNKVTVTLFTRPRRFGKTLTLSMLKTFFECEIDVNGNSIDNSRYFKDMKIMQEGEEFTNHLGKYPVISLSLKSAKQPDFDMAYKVLREQIADEFKRHRYILNGKDILKSERDKFEAIMSETAEPAEYVTSLKFLSDCLYKYHKVNTIILLDEYDVPLENAYIIGFYDKMVSFIRSLFESALKTNDSLEFAVVTGCLRISKESIFTGLNNLEVVSITNESHSNVFGFTEEELIKMLNDFDIMQKFDEIRRWYDGYRFGNTEIYNPWSVLNYVKSALININSFPKPYWSNTSSNSIIRELIENADTEVKQEIEGLLAGGTIEKPVHEDITYNDIHKSQDNLWNFLFFTGYLKTVEQKFYGDTIYITMTIPNAEVKTIYRSHILEWFDDKIKHTDLSKLYDAVLNADTKTMTDEICEQLLETISYYDYAENYYHGFLAGLLKGISGYIVLSNREEGNGRPDIILRTPSIRKTVFIIEIKVTDDYSKLEEGAKAALIQIEDRNYQANLEKEGYKSFVKYGICFCKKECIVLKNKE